MYEHVFSNVSTFWTTVPKLRVKIKESMVVKCCTTKASITLFYTRAYT